MSPRSASRSVVILSAAAIAGGLSMSPALAEEVLRTFAQPSPSSWTVSGEGGPTLKTVLTVDEPGIRGPRYGIAGEVRHRDVQGNGYLEMWNVLPQGRFFTRTLAPEGPMKALSGSSDWRPFLLPFFNEKGELIIAKLSPKGYEEIDRAKVLEPTGDAGPFGGAGRKVLWSYPAFAGKCMFARNDKEIVCASLATK